VQPDGGASHNICLFYLTARPDAIAMPCHVSTSHQFTETPQEAIQAVAIQSNHMVLTEIVCYYQQI